MGSLHNILLLIIIILFLYFILTYKKPQHLENAIMINPFKKNKEPFISDIRRYYNSNIKRPLRLQTNNLFDQFRKHTNKIHKKIR